MKYPVFFWMASLTLNRYSVDNDMKVSDLGQTRLSVMYNLLLSTSNNCRLGRKSPEVGIN